MSDEKRRVLLVTGMSGAGLSTALKALEDLGYKAVDNMPLSLITPLLGQAAGAGDSVAIAADSRTWDFSPETFLDHFDELKTRGDLDVKLLVMDCNDAVLQKRYTETRRRHPLAVDRPVSDGVARERAMIGPVMDHADILIDTSELKVPDLRRMLAGHFSLDDGHGLLVYVTSFGFKHGIPREADMIFDVRFLDNPHYDPELRPLSGLDAPVAAKVSADPDYPAFFENLKTLLAPLLPRYAGEGKSYLTIAIGCTGGQHRSVFVSERLYEWLDGEGHSVGISHRDVKTADGANAPAAHIIEEKRESA